MACSRRALHHAAILAVTVACSPAGRDAKAPSATPRPVIATLSALTGGVKVKTYGTQDWVNAAKGITLSRGDVVRTEPGAAAEIAFADGMVLRVNPDVLLYIEETPSLRSGDLTFSSERKDRERPPAIAGPSFRWTDSPDTEAPPAGAIAVDPSGDGHVDQHVGSGRVDTRTGESVELRANERVSVDNKGKAAAKVSLPPPPVPLAPAHGATLTYADPLQATTVLRWLAVPGAVSYHVTLDDDAWFADPMVDRAGVAGASLDLPGLGAGKYYWRVSAMDARQTEGAFSEFGRFTVAAAPAGPRLVIESIEVRKNVAQIKGRTDPGASVSVNGQNLDVREDGSFAEFITFQALGLQKLLVRAEGARGGVTTEQRSVSVTSY